MAEIDVRVRLLGPVAVDDGSGDALGPRLRRLLAALALGRGLQVSDSALIDVVWGEDGALPENPSRSLQTYVSRLRQLLGAEAIERSGVGYRLDPELVWLDITEFEQRLERSRSARAQADDRRAVAELEGALSLWSGDALSDFSGEAWVTAEAHRLDELRVDAEEQRAELLLGLDDIDGALIADLERLALGNPHREGPTRQLMVALHRAGRQADALAAFSRHRDQLATDLGLDPSAELVTLESQILTGDPAVAAVRSRSLRDYEIVERIGEGAFSIVYRGSQPSVGRDVAIKQIRADLANRPEFIRRFDAEARIVARLEHPHIVPLYDYWREPHSAYLVMRLLRGGNLETALRSGPWDLERAMRMVGDIGGALATAHRVGVVHRDVKPSNILLDDIGNAYLTDFGIALEAHEVADPMAALSAGSPAYASPEQLRHESADPTADVHGLGIVLYETLAGQLPFPDEPTQAALLQRQLHDPIPSLRETRPDVPAALDAVVTKATSKSPTDRYQSVQIFVDAVHEAIQGVVPEEVRQGVTTAARLANRNPYKGLRAFDEADAGDFAGRARLVDQLAARLRDARLLAVVGPSGSGKSSVVRAGLLPALRRGAVPGSDDWFVTTMLPGATPFEELEIALLRIATERPADLLGALTTGDRGIARGLCHAVPAENAQVLVVIDQFEELFTLAEPHEARRFLDALVVAVTEERPRLRVVLTLRADFYDRPLRHEALGRLVKDATVAVLPLAADELEQAIVEPAASGGVTFEPGLVSQIAADVADQPGALPLMQYVLTELYEHQVSGLLTQTAYRELGGVGGAIGRRAEELYLESSADEQIAIRRVFGRLVSLGEGTEDTRRRALRGELGEGDAVATVLERFGAARLLSFDRHPLSREPTVDLAHEAMLREWPRLSEWLDEDRDGLRLLGHLHRAATDWDERDRPPGELYRGGRLEAAEKWISDHPADLNQIESEYIAAGIEAREVEHDETRRTTRRLRQRLTGVAVVAVLALIAGAVAFSQQRSASRNADRAELAQADAEDSAASATAAQVDAESSAASATAAQTEADQQRDEAERITFDSETARLASQAAVLADRDPRVAWLLAVGAYERDPSPATLGALQQALVGSAPVLQQVNWGTAYLDAEWIPGERLIATTADRVDLIDLRTGDVESSLAAASAASAIPSSKRTATDAAGTLVALLTDIPDEAIEGPELSELSVYTVAEGFEQRFSVPLEAAGLNVAVSPSGDLIVVAGASATENLVTAWSPDGTMQWEAKYQREGQGIYVSVTRDQVFVSGDGWLQRLDHAGEPRGPDIAVEIASLRPDPVPAFVSDVVETDDGWRAFGWSGATARIDSETGFPTTLVLQTLEGVSSTRAFGTAVMVGDEVLSTELGGSVKWFDPATGASTARLRIGVGAAQALVLSPERDRFVVAHSLGLTVLALDERGPLAEALPRHPRHTIFTINTAGTRAVISSAAEPRDRAPLPVIWRLDDDGWAIDPDNPIEDWALEANVMPNNGDVLYARTNASREKAYDIETYEELWDWGPIPPQPVWGGSDLTAESPIGPLRAFMEAFMNEVRVYVPGDWDDPVQVLEAPSAARAGGQPNWITVRFDPSGDRLLLADRDGSAQLWDVATWDTINDDGFDEFDIGVGTWSDDGSIVATAATDGSISIRDGETFEVIRTMSGLLPAQIIDWMELSADGSLLLTALSGDIRLWDVASGQQIGVDFPHESALAAAGGNHDETALRLVTATETSALVWNLDTDTWVDVACRAAGSNLTAEEWAQWGPRDTERYAICPDYPLLD